MFAHVSRVFKTFRWFSLLGSGSCVFGLRVSDFNTPGVSHSSANNAIRYPKQIIPHETPTSTGSRLLTRGVPGLGSMAVT